MSRPIPRVRSATPWREPVPSFPAAPELRIARSPNPEPWPLDETDLPDEPLPIFPTPAELNAPLYLGSVEVTERGVAGPVSLDVMLAVDGAWLELGPLHCPRDALRRLCRLFQIVNALVGHDRRPAPLPTPEAGRGIAGWNLDPARSLADLALGSLSEGETRP